MLETKKPETPVGIVKSKDFGVDVSITTLDKLSELKSTCLPPLIIGNSMTYIQDGYMITPRGYRVSYPIHPLSREFYENYLEGNINVGPNIDCEYYPMPQQSQSCTFCYCPFYPCGEGSTGGKWIKDKGVWSCEDCEWIHNDETVNAYRPSYQISLKKWKILRIKRKNSLN